MAFASLGNRFAMGAIHCGMLDTMIRRINEECNLPRQTWHFNAAATSSHPSHPIIVSSNSLAGHLARNPGGGAKNYRARNRDTFPEAPVHGSVPADAGLWYANNPQRSVEEILNAQRSFVGPSIDTTALTRENDLLPQSSHSQAGARGMVGTPIVALIGADNLRQMGADYSHSAWSTGGVHEDLMMTAGYDFEKYQAMGGNGNGSGHGLGTGIGEEHAHISFVDGGWGMELAGETRGVSRSSGRENNDGAVKATTGGGAPTVSS
jgi:hypothetical protein